MSTPTSDDDLCSITNEIGRKLQPFDIQHINIEFYISIMLHKTEPRSTQLYMSMRWTGHLVQNDIIMPRDQKPGATIII
jgi:hypothetical protein